MGILYPDHPQDSHHPLNRYSTQIFDPRDRRASYNQSKSFYSNTVRQTDQTSVSRPISTFTSPSQNLNGYSETLRTGSSNRDDGPPGQRWDEQLSKEERSPERNERKRRDRTRQSTSPARRRESGTSAPRKHTRRISQKQSSYNDEYSAVESPRPGGPRRSYRDLRTDSSNYRRDSQFSTTRDTRARSDESPVRDESKYDVESHHPSPPPADDYRKQRVKRASQAPLEGLYYDEQHHDPQRPFRSEKTTPRRPEPVVESGRGKQDRETRSTRDRKPEFHAEARSEYPKGSPYSPYPPKNKDGDYFNSWDEEKGSRRHRRQQPSEEPSIWDEVEFYKFGRVPEDRPPRRQCFCNTWSRKKKLVVFGSVAAFVIILIIIIAAAVVASKNGYDYSPSSARVTNAEAFESGGATHNSPNNVNDGIGAGEDEYIYYSGDASNFPASSKWISFDDMWKNNLDSLQNSCTWLGDGQNDSPQDIDDIFDAIQNRANVSLVDHRFIFATILQESNGCVHVGDTTSSGGVTNPGLMQSHNGHTYDASHSKESILAMVQDGTQGTKEGAGLVQNLNRYGNPYEAARGYNSGHIAADGNLSNAAGATACYVSDIANRLTGWVNAKSTCPGDTA